MKIPRNLKPGDRPWYSKTEYATVSNIGWGRWDPGDRSLHAYTPTGRAMRYREDNGREVCGDTPPIIRIERIAKRLERGRVVNFAYRNVYAEYDETILRVRQWSGHKFSKITDCRVARRFSNRCIGYEILALDPAGRKAPVVVMFVSTEGKKP